jgi:sugar phosphate isomerase/epimerase
MPLRPAAITDEISQDFEHALDVLLEYGVRDAELRGLWGTNILDLTPEQQERARRALDERGIRVCSIASPLFKSKLPAAAQGPTPDAPGPRLERAIDLAEYFHTKLIRVFSFWREGELTEAVFQRIVAGLRPAVERAEEAGVVLGLENEHACFLGTGEEAARALREIDSPAFRAVWDPGNAYFAGEAPFPAGYAAVRPYVVHVHVKDAARGADGKPRWTVVGEGEIDYPGQISALVADGYEGVLSLETHYKPEGGTAEQGSRRCLEGLLRLMRD